MVADALVIVMADPLVSVVAGNVVCPQCGANAPKKLMSAFGFASSGKSVASISSGHNCSGCGSGHCETCH